MLAKIILSGLILAQFALPTRVAPKIYIPAPVGYWKLNEASGSTATDSAAANNGSWSGTARHSTSPTPPQSAGYFSAFDGSSYITASSSALPTGSSPRAMCGRFSTTTTTRQTLFGWGTGASGQAFVLATGIGGGSGNVYFVGYAADLTNTSTNFADGNWHLACATYNGTTVKIYVDGALNASGNLSLNTGTGSMLMGYEYDGYPYSGGLVSVEVWNVELTAVQIAALNGATTQ